VLSSGDQVEILTSNTQTPKQGWLDIVTTSKARNKIRQSLNEIESRQAAFARETIERKFKNRKIDYDEPTMMRLIKRMGYKQVKEFYQKIADGSLDVNLFIDRYVQAMEMVTEPHDVAIRSAEGYSMQQDDQLKQHFSGDVLVIDQNLKGIDFKLAQCCNPIYGDEVFGFVTTGGGIKIHRCDCPNAHDLHSRFGYRVVKARWAGKSKGSLYPITLTVIGHDDIGIVNNITSIISKEENIQLRNISINSHDGLFSGTLTVLIEENARLQALLKKLRTVKGVKQVNRN
jgi:GTP pyrophosphokinase